MRLSVVIPCHDEAESLPLFFDAIGRALTEVASAHPDMGFELMFVDDGSTDATLTELRAFAEGRRAGADEAGAGDTGADGTDPAVAGDAREAAGGGGSAGVAGCAVRWIELSRNFGKEAALYAGLRNASGDLVAVMDADLQDPPSLLPRMVDMLLDAGAELDCVATRRTSRTGEQWVRSLFAHVFYRLFNAATDIELVDGARDFRLMRRPMVDAILACSERTRFSKGLFSWVGFRTAWLSYDNRERAAGHSSWSLRKLVRYALDGIDAFTSAPLRLASWAGVVLDVVSLVVLVAFLVRLAAGLAVGGVAWLALLVTFLSGLQLTCLGIMGRYLASAYAESRRRPVYLVRSSNLGEAGCRRTGEVSGAAPVAVAPAGDASAAAAPAPDNASGVDAPVEGAPTVAAFSDTARSRAAGGR
ncbi:MAG: glycosyltransferase family 2 protein [Coriobacteriales bacterium]|jgi:glucosyltransferase